MQRPNERKGVAADLTPELVSELVAELWPALCLLPSNCYGLFQFLGHLPKTSADPQSSRYHSEESSNRLIQPTTLDK